ncbi:hypothetical protein LX36DRAFT_297552 [Colletotrichum falcatum]|nr:hypothetical protein LX36DRAFT_297552 [Colletotrichum falcatum]
MRSPIILTRQRALRSSVSFRSSPCLRARRVPAAGFSKRCSSSLCGISVRMLLRRATAQASRDAPRDGVIVIPVYLAQDWGYCFK